MGSLQFWIVVVVSTVGWGIASIFQEVTKEAGKDLYSWLKRPKVHNATVRIECGGSVEPISAIWRDLF